MDTFTSPDALKEDKILRSRPVAHRPGSGFTLVELLVVIGIIALLIAILLPALNKARQAAQRTACATKLQQIMIAANIHATEHKGFYPLVGQLNAHGDGPGQMSPDGLNDTYTNHYTYFGFQGIATGNAGDTRILAPIHYALGSEMGFKRNLANNTDALQSAADSDNTGVTRCFLCPSQATTPSDIKQISWLYAGTFGNYYGGYVGSLSYIFNEAVLGFDDSYGRLRGLSTSVRQPAKTVFAADGLPGGALTRPSDAWTAFNTPPPGSPPGPYGTQTFYNNVQVAGGYPPITLSDALTNRAGGPSHHALAGSPECFDRIRHQGKMNVAFCDGHVESLTIPNLKTDPNAVGLMGVYILAP